MILLKNHFKGINLNVNEKKDFLTLPLANFLREVFNPNFRDLNPNNWILKIKNGQKANKYTDNLKKSMWHRICFIKTSTESSTD